MAPGPGTLSTQNEVPPIPRFRGSGMEGRWPTQCPSVHPPVPPGKVILCSIHRGLLEATPSIVAGRRNQSSLHRFPPERTKFVRLDPGLRSIFRITSERTVSPRKLASKERGGQNGRRSPLRAFASRYSLALLLGPMLPTAPGTCNAGYDSVGVVEPFFRLLSKKQPRNLPW